MSSTQKNFALPLAFIGIMFFAIGFALGINSVLIPVLQGSLGITSAESYLIIAATFVPFLIFGYPASMTIKAIGYQTHHGTFVCHVRCSFRFVHSIG